MSFFAGNGKNASFDYQRYLSKFRPGPVQAGYQKTVRLPFMPHFQIFISSPAVRDKAEAKRLRQLTEDSICESTYAKVTVLDPSSAASLSEIAAEKDAYLCALQAGCTVEKDAFYRMAAALTDRADAIYTDQDTADTETGLYRDPVLKGAWNPDLLRSCNYIGSLFAVKASIAAGVYGDRTLPADIFEAGGAAGEMAGGSAGGSAEAAWDFTLRTTRACRTVRYLHRILVHVPAGAMAEAAPAGRPDTGDAGDSGVSAGSSGPLVSILIPNTDHVETLKNCLRSIRANTEWRNLEILILENGSVMPQTFEFYRQVDGMAGIRVVKWDGAPNYSEIINYGAQKAAGDYLLLLDSDEEILTGGWLKTMQASFADRRAAAVGPLLLSRGGAIESAGIQIGSDGTARDREEERDPAAGMAQQTEAAASRLTGGLSKRPAGAKAEQTARAAAADGRQTRALLRRDVSALNSSCMLIRKESFLRAGAFDTTLGKFLAGVDFCLKIRGNGSLLVFDPSVEVSRLSGAGDARAKRAAKNGKREIAVFRKKWKDVLAAGDPYFPSL